MSDTGKSNIRVFTEAKCYTAKPNSLRYYSCTGNKENALTWEKYLKKRPLEFSRSGLQFDGDLVFKKELWCSSNSAFEPGRNNAL